MADDGLLPLLLIAGAGYLLWKYTGAPAASPSIASTAVAASSWSDPQTNFAATPAPTLTRSSYFNTAYVPASQPPTAQQARPAPNPYWNPGGGAAVQNSGNDPIPDTSGYLRSPGNIDTGPTIQPTPQAVMTPDQIAFNQRCTYITGAPIPGCV